MPWSMKRTPGISLRDVWIATVTVVKTRFGLIAPHAEKLLDTLPAVAGAITPPWSDRR